MHSVGYNKYIYYIVQIYNEIYNYNLLLSILTHILYVSLLLLFTLITTVHLIRISARRCFVAVNLNKHIRLKGNEDYNTHG